MDHIFRKVERGIDALFGDERHAHTHSGHECHEHHPAGHAENRFQSFAPQTTGNAKWYVDGCSYFWAVSEAIERKLAPLSYQFLSNQSSFSDHVSCRGPREHLHLGLVAEPRAVPAPPSLSE